MRTAAGLTQAELAERAGVSRKTVNTIENRVFTPSVVVALTLAKALDVPLGELFELID
jgi:putative transcriptional regulator